MAKTTRRPHAPRIKSIPITEARRGLGALVKRIHLDGELVVLENNGLPLAAIIGIEIFKQHWGRHLKRSSRAYGRKKGRSGRRSTSTTEKGTMPVPSRKRPTSPHRSDE